ncbi:MAG: hypothetical protein GY730_08800 [bacterium]|nr:hypothetical protein [bacterium]
MNKQDLNVIHKKGNGLSSSGSTVYLFNSRFLNTGEKKPEGFLTIKDACNYLLELNKTHFDFYKREDYFEKKNINC